jgi:hypothetical protein
MLLLIYVLTDGRICIIYYNVIGSVLVIRKPFHQTETGDG